MEQVLTAVLPRPMKDGELQHYSEALRKGDLAPEDFLMEAC